ncbi:MAG: glycosyltransferase, partial [Acidimicrobiales bacterium]
IVDVSRMQRVAPAPATQELLSGIEGPKYLFVGQMLPHKRPDLLLKSFHALSTYIEPDAHLFMVGAGRLPNYLEVVHQFVKELNLHRAYLTGPVSDEDLAAFYQGCDVFVTPSEHEGFCIPLLEAMAFELPIVARDFAAIPETLGGAGLLLDAEATVLGLAEGMHELIANRELVETYRRLGKDRLEAFDADRSRATFLSHIAELV